GTTGAATRPADVAPRPNRRRQRAPPRNACQTPRKCPVLRSLAVRIGYTQGEGTSVAPQGTVEGENPREKRSRRRGRWSGRIERRNFGAESSALVSVSLARSCRELRPPPVVTAFIPRQSSPRSFTVPRGATGTSSPAPRRSDSTRGSGMRRYDVTGV